MLPCILRASISVGSIHRNALWIMLYERDISKTFYKNINCMIGSGHSLLIIMLTNTCIKTKQVNCVWSKRRFEHVSCRLENGAATAALVGVVRRVHPPLVAVNPVAQAHAIPVVHYFRHGNSTQGLSLWTQCDKKYPFTVVEYGETCRYLVRVPLIVVLSLTKVLL